MPSPFFGIDLASRALRAFQRGLDVTGHNIANVNTRGYSRQVIDYSTPEPTTYFGIHALSLGNGVDVNGVNRVRDQFLDARMRVVQGDMGKTSSYMSALQNVQNVMNEPSDNGIAASMNKFFDSWSGLAANPGDSSRLLEVQHTGQTLAARIRTFYKDLTAESTELSSQMGETVKSVNDLTKQIAKLNDDIRSRVATGDSPNDLLDARNTAVQDLSQLVDVQSVIAPDGALLVNMSGYNLVDGAGQHDLPATYDPVAQTFTDTTGGTYKITTGQLAGQFQAFGKVTALRGQIDTLANTLRTQINTVHKTGINGLGQTGIDFFNDSNPQTGAQDFDLSAAVSADPKAIASGISGNAGDGGLALSLAGLRDSPVVALGNKGFKSFYGDIVTGVGHDVSTSKQNADTTAAIADQTQSQIDSSSGVSLDEEMSNMLRFQRSYQAAAKALSVFDQVTDDLINMLKR